MLVFIQSGEGQSYEELNSYEIRIFLNEPLLYLRLRSESEVRIVTNLNEQYSKFITT